MTRATLIRWLFSMSLALLLAGALLLQAARAQDAAGDWSGVVQSPALGPLRIEVTIQSTPEGLKGALTSPDQSPTAVPMDEVKVEDGRLTFAISRLFLRYEGTWDADRQAWVGELVQGASIPLTLSRGKSRPAS